MPAEALSPLSLPAFDPAGDLGAHTRALLTQVGALREGHFLLTSGRHSDRFFLLARLFEHPHAGSWVARALAARVTASVPAVSTVVGPAVGGIILAYDVARFLDARAMYAEKEADGTMRLKRGFRLEQGERVLVVEDALTTGGSVAKAAEAASRQGAVVAAVATIVRRGHHAPPFTAPLVSLVEDDARDWTPEACPMCRDGIELERPKG